MRRNTSENIMQSLASQADIHNNNNQFFKSKMTVLNTPDDTKNISKRRKNLSLQQKIGVVLVVSFVILKISFQNITSHLSQATAVRLFETTSDSSDIAQVVSDKNIETQVAAQVTSQIKPLHAEVAELRSNIEDLSQLLEKMSFTQKDTQKQGLTNHVDWENSNDRSISVFFNTYQPLNVTGSFPFEVIYDQMKRLNDGLLHNKTVYYTRFGNLTNWPYAKCSNKKKRQCVQIAASEQGDEVITLQYLYNFCIKNPLDRVVYIHSKGTHTKSWNNRMLKKVLMKAVSSPECLYQMGTGEMQCNACSSQLTGLPPHYPGNMWVADCDYIGRLIPPNQFEQMKAKVASEMQNATRKLVPDNDENDYFVTELDDNTKYLFHNGSMWMMVRESWLGVKRYAMEHWLGSHPDFTPCEVFSPKDGIPQFRYDTLKQKKIFADEINTVLQMAPGKNFKESWHHPYKLHPWYKKAGKLYEYRKLYSKIPPPSSWFYTYWNGVKDR